MPIQLFKYRRWFPTTRVKRDGTREDVNYTERLLSDHSFFCQQPMGFDDPHDGHTGAVPTGSVHDIDRFAQENMSAVSGAMTSAGLTSLTQLQGSAHPSVRAALSGLAGQHARRRCYALSLSAVGDSDVMWSFYADEHRGICLELDGEHPCFAGIREVQYGTIPPAQSSEIGASDPLLYHKSVSWVFQREWRLASTTAEFPFPAEALRRVILGYRFPETGFQPLRDILVQGGYCVAIDQMQRRAGSYSLEPFNRGEITPVGGQ